MWRLIANNNKVIKYSVNKKAETNLDTSSTHLMAKGLRSTGLLCYPPIAERCRERYSLVGGASASGVRPKGLQVRRGLGLRKGHDRALIGHCTISRLEVGASAREPGNPPEQWPNRLEQ